MIQVYKTVTKIAKPKTGGVRRPGKKSPLFYRVSVGN
jgi:hypothetical protein